MQAIHSKIICTSITLAMDQWLTVDLILIMRPNPWTTIIHPLVTCINMHHSPWEPPKAPQQHFENETEQVMQIFNSIQQHNQVLTLESEE